MATTKNKTTPLKKNKPHLEIERKFLMRRLPKELLAKRKHEVIEIVQYYFYIDGVWQRFRIASDKKSTKYIHTVKKSISTGVYEENEKQIEKSEFLEIFKKHEKKYYYIKYYNIIQFGGCEYF